MPDIDQSDEDIASARLRALRPPLMTWPRIVWTITAMWLTCLCRGHQWHWCWDMFEYDQLSVVAWKCERCQSITVAYCDVRRPEGYL